MNRLWLGLGLLALAASAAASRVIRGAAPDILDKYQPVDGKFTCFDGSKTIDFNQVNDNFCDCPDSSDEPGTSACPNGVFYCRNRGHEPKLLSTSFVDDGVCDCCDGTDELSGCKNTCIEKNSAKRDTLKKKIDEYKQALDRKSQYATSAAGVRANIKQRFQNVDQDIVNTEQEVQKLSADNKRIEEETAVKREEHKKEQAELAAKRKAEREALAAKKAEEEKAAAEKAAAEEQAAADAETAGDEQQPAEPVEESAEERGRRIAAQWTNDPAAAGPAGSDAPSSDEAADQSKDEDVTADKPAGWTLSKAWTMAKDRVQKMISQTNEAEENEAADADDSTGAGADDDEPWTPEEDPPHHDYDEHSTEDAEGEGAAADSVENDPDYQAFDDSALQTAKRDLTAAEKKLADLQAEKERVTRQVTYTFNDAWAGLMNKCLESREPQFTYKFCFFDKAAQVDNGGGHETSLGKWKGFEKGGTEAVFEGGDYCHKNPARSLRVSIECGTEEKAWGASEPSVCAYTAHMSTPAACKQDKLQELQNNFEALLAEEAALAKELEEEEAQRQRDLAEMKARLAGGEGHDEL